MKEKYIELLLEKCVDKNSKILFISYNKEIYPFVEQLVRRAKEKGIEEVYLDVEDIYYTHDLLKNSTKEEISNNAYFDQSIWDVYAKKGAGFLIFETEYPNLMEDVDAERISLAAKKKNDSRPFYKKLVRECKLSWCIATYPGKLWADSLFSTPDSYEKLENAIFQVCMINQEDPLACWDNQLKKVEDMITILNHMNLEKLHYSNSLGTSLDIYLPDNYCFSSAKDNNVIVNMPSYEVFASPHYLKTEGIVYSSKPLNYNGKIVDKFFLKFMNGKVVDYGAKVGEDVLKSIIERDLHSCYLGECALVPYDSPISNLNMTFGTTLIDENASCHLALGAGFAECLVDGLSLNEIELLKRGINCSKTHVDFMIGTSDLSIVGLTKDKQEVLIFKNGNFNITEKNEYIR